MRLITIALVSMVTTSAGAAPPSTCQVTRRAADHLAGTLTGLFTERAGWQWRAGQGSISPNISGLAALALVDAAAALADDRYTATARQYADVLLSTKMNWHAGELPYKADIELLARLEGDYLPHAQDAWAVIVAASPTGGAEVARIAAGRQDQPALVGFDVSLGIRAAVAVGQRAYAEELADAAVATRDQWYQPKNAPRFSTLSAAALVVALEQLGRPRDAEVITALRRDIRARQHDTGAWLGNETQPTAYAVMALAGSRATPDREAIAAGLTWLKETMLRDGGYAHFNDKLPEPFVGDRLSEVQAEVVTALAGECRRGGA